MHATINIQTSGKLHRFQIKYKISSFYNFCREKVARGNTILFIDDHQEKTNQYDGVIFALRLVIFHTFNVIKLLLKKVSF